jgi:hypothetical protein
VSNKRHDVLFRSKIKVKEGSHDQPEKLKYEAAQRLETIYNTQQYGDSTEASWRLDRALAFRPPVPAEDL